MSEARERYYKLKSELEHLGNEGLRGEIDDYVNELEQQLSELKESQKQKQIIRLCERLDEAERQNERMLELLKFISEYFDIGQHSNLCEAIFNKDIKELLRRKTR